MLIRCQCICDCPKQETPEWKYCFDCVYKYVSGNSLHGPKEVAA